MDEREFQRMLERFPVVRKKTHARVEWNAIADPTRTASSTAPRSTELPQVPAAPMASFQETMETFLHSYFTSQETDRILQELSKAHKDFVGGLCLEDINDICAQFVTPASN